MGNAAASCAPSLASSGAVKVLLPDGTIEIYMRPVNTAQLMVENPGQFVCNPARLVVGQRIEGVPADKDLEPRRSHSHLYFLLPMEMLYSVLTEDELTYLTHKATTALKNGNSLNLAKIFPVLGDFCMFPTSSEAKSIQETGHLVIPKPAERSYYSRQRSWIPALETIAETTPPRRP